MVLIWGISRIYNRCLFDSKYTKKFNIVKYILLLEHSKNNGINYKSDFLYAFMYLDTELQRRLPSKVAVLLKVSIVYSEKMSSCIQGTNNAARDFGFSDSRGVDNYSVWGGISSVSDMGGSPGDVGEAKVGLENEL